MSGLALLVPARNARAHLGRLLDSVARQTSPFDEIWLFDDASDDGTGDMARQWGASVVRSDVCVGPSAGKNRLAAETTCDWIHFHDADDALAPQFVSRARQWMLVDSTDVVLFGTEDVDEATGQSLARTGWSDADLTRDPGAYAVRQPITNCGIYRRHRFLDAGGFPVADELKYSEDQAMHIQLAMRGLRFRADPYPGVVIHRRQGSMSSAHPVECARSQVEVLKRVAAETGARYRTEVGARAWHLAGVCAGFSDWSYVKESLGVARRVGYRVPSEEHPVVCLVGAIAPGLAVHAREWFIRVFKSHLRQGLPAAGDVVADAPARQVSRSR